MSLLSPYTPDGVQKVTEIKRDENGIIRENLIIKGNNLLALHTLKTQFRGQKKLLCEMLNKNQLYVNLSEIEDEKFAVSNEDKVLNKTFYMEAYNG